ncbi:hypothetical protein [Maridesulfovibrio bastinii]|uniref:hypothetical protein n=1 Tax=Maridesulfovibrio bastinii TaxID=47157 RepID=UPI00041785EF|nr:hypothetical protein [Maridesulfovibrio bastinii]
MYAFEIPGGYTFYKYRDFDETLSLSPEHLHWFWRLMSEAGQQHIIFYDGSIISYAGFRKLAEQRDQHFFLGFKDGRPSGLFWLNGFGIKTCFIHMAILADFHGRGTLEMGRGVLRHLLTARDVDGEYFLKNVKGLVPVANPLACRMAVASGFREVGTITGDAYLASRDKHVDAVLYCATLENLKDRGIVSQSENCSN